MVDSLDLAEIQRRPAIVKLLGDVKALASRPVNFRHMADWNPIQPGLPEQLHSPAMVPTDNSYDVYLNEILSEQMAVHELLHVILVEEGYPDIKFDEAKAPANAPNRESFERMYDGLVNKFQHPEIYRRMKEVYGQDMPPYRAYVATGLVNELTFDTSTGILSFPLGRQSAIADIIEHLYLQPESQIYLDRYRSLAGETYAVGHEIKREMDRIGFKTPQDALRCLNLFLERVFQYGKTMSVNLDNDLWRALTWYLPGEIKRDGIH